MISDAQIIALLCSVPTCNVLEGGALKVTGPIAEDFIISYLLSVNNYYFNIIQQYKISYTLLSPIVGYKITIIIVLLLLYISDSTSLTRNVLV